MCDIVFVTVDSLRVDHVGWHGYDRDTTPFLDGLAEGGHTFERAFATGECTRTSFPGLLTSVYASMYGGKERLSDRQVPVAEPLRSAGYATAGFHSNPHLLPKFGYDRGFDTFYDSNTKTSRLARLRQWVKDNLDQSGLLYRSLERAFAASEETVGFNPGTPFVLADELTDRAIEWATSVDGSDWFLWVHYMDVHHPYSPPDRFQREFRESPVSERRAVKLRRKMLEEPEAITDAELRTLIDLYDGEIRFVDHEVQRLVETVRAEWESDPIVVFTSDHGDEFLDHGQFSHLKTLYDELLHVPLLLHDGEGSGTYDDVVELIDVPPTLLSYADADAPSTYEGSSLRPVLDGDGKDKQHAVCDAGDTVSYRDERWKYIERPDAVELYDARNDPDETDDIAANHPEVVDDLAAVLDAHRERVADTDEDLDDVEFDGEVQDRLEQLGYLQE